MDGIRELLAAVAVPLILWSLVQAAILQWRARKVKAITIPFFKALYVSIMACCAAIAFFPFAGVVTAALGALVVALALGNTTNGAPDEVVTLIASLCTIVVWHYAHSKLLARVAASSAALSPKDARAITSEVFAVMIGIMTAIAGLYMLVFSLTSPHIGGMLIAVPILAAALHSRSIVIWFLAFGSIAAVASASHLDEMRIPLYEYEVQLGLLSSDVFPIAVASVLTRLLSESRPWMIGLAALASFIAAWYLGVSVSSRFGAIYA